MAIFRPSKGDVMGMEITPWTPKQKAQYAREQDEKEWGTITETCGAVDRLARKFREKVARDLEKLKKAKP